MPVGRRAAGPLGNDAGAARTPVRLPSWVVLAGLALALGASTAVAAPLTETGRRAYETARSARRRRHGSAGGRRGRRSAC